MQTSIEWLVKSLSDRMYIHCPDFGHTIIDKLVEQAKEMHKLEQENLYTKEDVLKAGEIGEINHFDYKHIVSLLDEAKAINKSFKKD